MKSVLLVLAFVVAGAAPAGAYPAGMAAMQYYVGTWSCAGGMVGQPAGTFTVTYTLDSDLMRQWVSSPPQGKMTTPYVASSATTYDAKQARYVQTFIGNDANWSLSVGNLSGANMEQWTDQSTTSGKLGHGQVVRTDQNTFTYSGFPTASAAQPDFKVTCTRGS